MTEQVRPEVLISRLTSDTEAWRVEAELRLIALGAGAVEPLIGALSHASPAVRVHAVHALGRIRDLRALPAIARMLGDAENLGAAAIAAEKALVEWGEPAAPALLAVARGEASEAARARAIRALGKLGPSGGGGLRPVLELLLKDASPAIRLQAAVALGTALREGAITLIAPLLADPDKWVRYEVAGALARLGCVRGEPALREALGDPEEQDTDLPGWAEELLDGLEEWKRTGRAIA